MLSKAPRAYEAMVVKWKILITLYYSLPDRISSSIEDKPELSAHSDRHVHMVDILCLLLLMVATI